MSINVAQPANLKGRQALSIWLNQSHKNPYEDDFDLKHSVEFYFKDRLELFKELSEYAEEVIKKLEPLIIENNLAQNLPRIERYDGIGQFVDQVIHHPFYEASGNIIYGSRLLERMSIPGGLLEALLFMFISSQVGEAGHHCPIACSAGIIRVLQKVDTIPDKEFYLQKLIEPSYTHNFTGAQFLTEVQGGSDVGLNGTKAEQDETGTWRITGEKWFCSNANADLILITARFQDVQGTKGLGLFLLPRLLSNGEKNRYTLRRLKDKIGTRSMASAEIDFDRALAYPVGPLSEGFKMVMENVLHISRLFNTICVLAMARRAYFIAYHYSKYRIAFGKPIGDFPLIQEHLACIKAENTALLASVMATVQLQDQYDKKGSHSQGTQLLLRLLANLNKYLSSLWSVEHIHHALDVLAGNGAIETFSIIPRLLRDAIVCENWEGTHNTLRMQILKDYHKYQIDKIFIYHVEELIRSFQVIEPYLTIFTTHKQTLEKEFQQLKDKDSKIQTLLIKDLVDQMIYLYAAIHLYQEAIDQESKQGHTKRDCLDLFIRLHLSRQKAAFDQDYLDLLQRLNTHL